MKHGDRAMMSVVPRSTTVTTVTTKAQQGRRMFLPLVVLGGTLSRGRRINIGGKQDTSQLLFMNRVSFQGEIVPWNLLLVVVVGIVFR